MAEGDTFATAINCMDGRVQAPVTEWMQRTFGVTFVDMITAPGPIKVLTGHDPMTAENIRQRTELSVHKHGSRVVALVAHADCAGNPVTKEESLEQLKAGIEVVRDWELPVTIAGLWVDFPEWNVEQLHLIEHDKH
jgi:carbonic anhydrase